MTTMKYNAKELAEMAIRNIESARKCGTDPSCADPVDSVAGVFAVPLETLARVEHDNTSLRERLNYANRLIEMFAQNIGGAVQVADPLIVQAAENYLGRNLDGPATRN